jgi:tRNA modification GTPase
MFLGYDCDASAEVDSRYGLGTDSGLTPPLITRERHRTHFVEALQFLQAFLDTRKSPHPYHLLVAYVCYAAREEPVLAAEELRYAAQAIAKVTGRIDVENVLDVVFSEFCIGK